MADEITAPKATESVHTGTEAVPASKPADADVEMTEAEPSKEDASESKPVDEATNGANTEMDTKDDDSAAVAETDAPAATENGTSDAAATPKPKAPPRRKSTGVPEHKGKKLNKKASKAQILHTDAKPGDQYFIKLKGFPPWPCIICDEDMLPVSLTKSRPVGATRPDGTYRDDYADGGKKVAERVFPIMYLSTNEFGWAPNKDLVDLDPETVMEQTNGKTRKDLAEAHKLASEKHDISYYRGELQRFQDEIVERQEAEKAKKAAAAAAAENKKTPKKAKATTEGDDSEMPDADGAEPAKPSKKRKAQSDVETPQRSDSVKKTKIKLNNKSTPKATNGATPKAAKSETKSKKEAKNGSPAAVEPEMTEEEKHARKSKEVLFLRHKLQKGLLTRDQPPKAEEMKAMSEYVSKLESWPDLEVTIIKTTKINKVLKAILKLESIPKEAEHNFKDRSQALLDKWNKLLAVEEPAASGANGVNGGAKHEEDEAKTPVNGAETVEKDKDEVKAEEKGEEKTVEKSEEKSEEKAEEASVEAEKVEAS